MLIEQFRAALDAAFAPLIAFFEPILGDAEGLVLEIFALFLSLRVLVQNFIGF